MNLINDQTYRVRVELERKTCAFQSGQMVYGSLVPWHDEWYWSGTQKTWENPPRDFSSVKREFREKSSFVAYRYCPDLAQRAREFAAEHFADFVRFHGSDLALFPDGLSAAAAEQKRLRVFSEIKAGEDLEKILRKHGVERPGQGAYPRQFVENEKGAAIFYHEGKGTFRFEKAGRTADTGRDGNPSGIHRGGHHQSGLRPPRHPRRGKLGSRKALFSYQWHGRRRISPAPV